MMTRIRWIRPSVVQLLKESSGREGGFIRVHECMSELNGADETMSREIFPDR